jgi:hypothetical protein
VASDLCTGQTEFFPAPLSYFNPHFTDAAASVAALQFFLADIPFPAFFVDDLLYRSAAPLELDLSKLLFFGFFENRLDKVPATKYPFIGLFSFVFASHGKHL